MIGSLHGNFQYMGLILNWSRATLCVYVISDPEPSELRFFLCLYMTGPIKSQLTLLKL